MSRGDGIDSGIARGIVFDIGFGTAAGIRYGIAGGIGIGTGSGIGIGISDEWVYESLAPRIRLIAAGRLASATRPLGGCGCLCVPPEATRAARIPRCAAVVL